MSFDLESFVVEDKFTFYSASNLNKILNNTKGRYVALFNLYSWRLAKVNPEISDIFAGAFLICDSFWIGKVFRRYSKTFEICRGVDFLRLVIQSPEGRGRHLFLGSDDETLTRFEVAIGEIKDEFCEVFFHALPPDVEIQEAKEIGRSLITESNYDYVWVTLGTPKQDFVGIALSKDAQCRVIGIGAAVNFLANPKTEAPNLMRKIGLEWMYRLIFEPRRLTKRYLESLLTYPSFVSSVRNDR